MTVAVTATIMGDSPICRGIHRHAMPTLRLPSALMPALMLALVLAAAPLARAQPIYRFSPVNQWDITRTAAYWNPIIRYVSEKSGLAIELKIGRTSADTTAYVLAREVEFVFSNHLFSPARQRLGWKVFGRRIAPTLKAQIVVPTDSPLTGLDQLRGHEIAYAGPEAFIGYKVPSAHLAALGIPVRNVFSGNQNSAFVQLFAGRTAAVGSNSMLVDGYAAREKRAFRVLWESEGFHDLALMASSKVPQEHVGAVADAFFGMHTDPSGYRVLERASKEVSLTVNDHFIAASLSDYRNYVTWFETAPAHLQ